MILNFLKRLFKLDPILEDAYNRTVALDAAANNGQDFFLICRPFVNHNRVDRLECEDKRIYIRQVPKGESDKFLFGRRWDD